MNNIIPPNNSNDAQERAEQVRARRDSKPGPDLETAILRVAHWLGVDVDELYAYKNGEPWSREELRQLANWTDNLNMDVSALCRHLGVQTHLDVSIQRDGRERGRDSKDRRELRQLLDQRAPGLLDRAQKLTAAHVDGDFVKRHLREYAMDARGALTRLLAAVGE